MVGEAIARLVAPKVVRRAAVAVEVQTGAERPSGAGEDRHPARAVPGDRYELRAQLGGHRVQLLRAVEREQADVRRRLV